jgi:uncharacterized protein YpuA (DUF1002 family)
MPRRSLNDSEVLRDMSGDDEELEELRRQTDRGSRIDEAADQEAQHELASAIQSELEAIDDGDRQKTLSAWDGPLAALMTTLEDRPDDLEQVVQGIERELDVGLEDPKRSEILALLMRVGLQETAPDLADALRDAVQEHATRGL